MNPASFNDPAVIAAVKAMRQAFQDFDKAISGFAAQTRGGCHEVTHHVSESNSQTVTQFKPSGNPTDLKLARVLSFFKPVGRVPFEQDVFEDADGYDPRASFK